MQIILSIFVALFAFSSYGADRSLNAKITHLEELERKVVELCLEGDNSSSVNVTIQGTTYTCPQLIVVTNRLHDELDKEVGALEACQANTVTPQGNALATDVVAAARKAGACPVKSTDVQCLGEFGCTLMVASNPLGALIGGMSKLAGSKNSCLAKGFDSTQNCLANVMKGIFDSLWGLISMIWDVGKAAVRSAGEWLGIIKKHEDASSDKLLAAQQAGPGFIKRFVSDPVKTIKDMATSMYNGIKEAAMSSYGCEKWSGTPFISRCLVPMTNWQCASCQQKMQLMCGIAGFAVGEIGTALLTGGLAAGGKAVAVGTLKAIQFGARESKLSKMAITAIQSIPKGAEGLEVASRATMALAKGTGRVLTVTEKNAIRAWRAVERSKASRAIQVAADKVSKSAAGQATRIALKPAAMYMDALEGATNLGFRTVDNALAGATTKTATVVETVATTERTTTEAAKVLDPRITPDMKRIAGLSDVDRLKEAESALGRTLSEAQEKAILESHNVGAGTGRGYFTYNSDEILEKGLILKRAGFEPEEIRKLMEKGITGALPEALDRYDGIRASNLATKAVDQLKGAQGDPTKVADLMKTYKEQNQVAAQSFASEARTRLADGDKAYSLVNTGLSIEKYIQAGDVNGAMAMINSGLGQGMTKEGVLKSLSQRLNLDPNTTRPDILLQRKTFAQVKEQLSPKPVVTPTPKPVVTEVKPQVKPEVKPEPAPVPEPIKAPPVAKVVSPREASNLANDYRLGQNGKVKSPELASQYYMQAAEENFKKEMIRKRGYNEGSNYLGDRNIHGALTESLSGDGTVALKMVDRLATETKGGHGLNEFISEMHELNAYSYKNNPQARANMMKIIKSIEEKYKDKLYSPQQSMMRSWRSANDW